MRLARAAAAAALLAVPVLAVECAVGTPAAQAYSYRTCSFSHYYGSYYTHYLNCDGAVYNGTIYNQDLSGSNTFNNVSSASTKAIGYYYPSAEASFYTAGYVLRYSGDNVLCGHVNGSGDTFICDWGA